MIVVPNVNLWVAVSQWICFFNRVWYGFNGYGSSGAAEWSWLRCSDIFPPFYHQQRHACRSFRVECVRSPFPSLSLSNFTCNGPLTLLLDRIDVTFPLLISFDIQIHMTTTPCYGKQKRQSRIAMRHGRRLWLSPSNMELDGTVAGHRGRFWSCCTLHSNQAWQWKILSFLWNSCECITYPLVFNIAMEHHHV